MEELSTKMLLRARFLWCTLIVAQLASTCLEAPRALASDHWNLEEELPTEVEDAYASDYLKPELQSLFRYERLNAHQERFVLSPRFLYGFARDWQSKVSVPFLLGSADKTGSGNLGFEVLDNFNHESQYSPALAVAVGADLPTGRQNNGIDTNLKLIGTKALGETYLDHRLHLNMIWNHNAGPMAAQRSDRYSAILGYSHPIPADLILVMDLAREQELEKGKTDNLVEAGLRHMVTPHSVASLGAGFGAGKDSPDFRITFGFQYEFR